MSTMLMIPLSAITDTLLKAFDGAREALSGHYKFAALASGLAAIFIVFRLIKIVNDIEGDDSAGGFGHVPLWEMLRPLVFYFLTLLSASLIGYIDGATRSVTDQIVTQGHEISFVDYQNLYGTRLQDNPELQAINETIENSGWGIEKVAGLAKWTWFIIKEVMFNNYLVRMWVMAGITQLGFFIYDLICAFMLLMGNVAITLIMIFGPFMFAFSILEPWKTSWQKLIANIVYYELWYPITGILKSVIYSVMSSVVKVFSTTGYTSSGAFYATVDTASLITAFLIQLTVILVGIALISQVPTFASQVIALGASSSGKEMDVLGRAAKNIPGANKFI